MQRILARVPLLAGILAMILATLTLGCAGSDSSGGPTTTGDPSPMAEPTTTPETDREALVALYHATDGPNWSSNTNWLSDKSISEWEGVTTGEDGRVVGLFLAVNDLRGEMPPELGQLAKLETLNFQHDYLVGEIPRELGQLTNLKEIHLGRNQVSGEIPPDLGQLTNLTFLDISRNQLSGEIPPELGQLANLEELWLNHNELSGEIPPELGQLTKLETLVFLGNDLTGEIPPELGRLSNLKLVSIAYNNMSGEIPSELGRLSNLELLTLGNNQLSGKIPPELGQLSNLSRLGLDENHLSGAIPVEVGNLTNLTAMGLAGNQLTGCVPTALHDNLMENPWELGDLFFCGIMPTPTPEPTSVPVAEPAPATDATPIATPSSTPVSTPEPTDAPVVVVAPVRPASTPTPEPTDTQVVTVAVTPIPAPTADSRTILSFNDENMEAFLSEFSEAERSCLVDNVEGSYLSSIQLFPYKHSAPEDVWLQFLQCLGDESLVRLLFTQYRGLYDHAYGGGYFDHIGDQAWNCIRAGFAALEMNDLVTRNPRVIEQMLYTATYLTTPCLSQEEWVYLVDIGLERRGDGTELDNFRCLTDEYGDIQAIGAELKYFLGNPELQYETDERAVAFREAQVVCGFE